MDGKREQRERRKKRGGDKEDWEGKDRKKWKECQEENNKGDEE